MRATVPSCRKGLAFALCLLATSAQANDSIGHLAAGGIVLARTADIEMREEELFVSLDEIRVRYRFLNKSERDVDTLVAFPMPEIVAPSDWQSYAIPVDDPVNFLAFQTAVDGKPVAMAAEQRVFALGIDRTELLRSLGIPLAPQLDVATEAIRRLSEPQQRELLSLGILRAEEYDVGQGMRRYLHPDWSLRTTFHWRQVFPSRQELRIEHRYKPSVGATAGTVMGTDLAEPEAIESYRRRFCADRAFLDQARMAHKRIAASSGTPLMEQRLEYILTTGAHWAGPIQSFRLVVDKGAPDNLVSFCGEGQTAISPTQVEIRATDYWPERNLEVLVLAPLR